MFFRSCGNPWINCGILIILLIPAILLSGCQSNQAITHEEGPEAQDIKDSAVEKEQETKDRPGSMPSDAVKVTPENDPNPPLSHSDDYENPVPLGPAINTAGAEDSAFILPDGNTLYFFFTPDADVPVEKQIIDRVTGIYVSKKTGSAWSQPEKVVLQDKGKASLDGCLFVKDNKAWFCTTREGYAGMHWATAERIEGKWQNWRVEDFPEDYDIGELHMHKDRLYFHSERPGGKGGLDIWVSEKADGGWSEPVNVEPLNTEKDEGWPALSPDGKELWISRDYGLWKSKRANSKWTEPELMISPLAGEASIDSQGNVYFTHHFFEGDRMIEADIYVAERK